MPTELPDKTFYSVDEVATYLSVGPGTVYTLIESGRLGAIRVGKKLWRIPRTELQRFLAEAETRRTVPE